MEGEDGVVFDYVYVFVDRVKPLTALAKCLGLFSERIQIELLQAQSGQHREDYSQVSDEVSLASIDRLERVKADLLERNLPAPNLPEEGRRLLHSRVVSSAA
jgi:hypothetical protein